MDELEVPPGSEYLKSSLAEYGNEWVTVAEANAVWEKIAGWGREEERQHEELKRRRELVAFLNMWQTAPLEKCDG